LSTRQRIDDAPAFVLHTHAYRETSLIVDMFSRDHGRVAVLAKGARRPTSQWRGLLMAFRPLVLAWSGAGEVRNLVRAEAPGGMPLLSGRALLCGYYLNELLLRLTAREDPHPEIFEAYALALKALAFATEAEAPVLRRFELTLLQSLGYGLFLDEDARSGHPVRDDAHYVLLPDEGVVEVEPGETRDRLPGRVLLALHRGDFSEPETLLYGKKLLRHLIQQQLGGMQLQSRRILMELQEL